METKRARPKICPGSYRRVQPTGSSAFPEVDCPCCELYSPPVRKYGEHQVRSHRPVGNWREFGSTEPLRDRSEDAPSGASADRPHPATDGQKEPNMAAATPTASASASEVLAKLADDLIGKIKAVKGVKAETRKAYVRFTLKGKTLVYVGNPTRKQFKVAIPKASGGGYVDVHVTNEAQATKAMGAINERVALLANSGD